MSKLLALPAGPRAKWIVFLAWLAAIAGGIGAGLPAKFEDAEQNDSTSFLPGDAESTRALAATERLQGGEQAPIVVVYRREGGLTPADRTEIQRRLTEFNRLRAERAADGEAAFEAVTPLAVAEERPDALIATGAITGDGESETILEPVRAAREVLSDPGGGLEGKVTGPAGFAADAIDVFQGINGTLLGAAVSLVFILLILIYRSPLFLWIPLTSVVFAEIGTRHLGWAVTELGVTVNGQSSSILSVLVLGAGTDYALLLVSRFREELHRHEDKHDAAALALRTAGPAIVASAGTVIAALLCLSVAEVNGTAGLGPIGAMGVLVAMFAMLTLLPALLTICGRRAFWPLVPYGPSRPRPARLARLPLLRQMDAWGRRWERGHQASETGGFWRRLGDRVAARPRRVAVATTAGLLVMALGVLNFSTGLTQSDAYTEEVESLQGQELLEQSFPAGANAPLDVIVPDPGEAEVVAAAVEEVDGVAAVRPNADVRRGAEAVLLSAVLEVDPYSKAAYDLVPAVRRAARSAAGSDVLVGGSSAVEKDLRDAAGRDTRLIVPMTLVVVFLILVLLLRALVAPVALIATVILSFFAAIGVGAVVFDVIFGFPGSDPSMPLFAFVFLVALGIDYNIFLMARVREETLRHGTREGVLRGLAVTGGVITSAGIVLAGTFSVLAVLPLVFLTQLGFVIAFGVLLDTFVVRSVLVPALVSDLGPRVWWPSRLAREDGGVSG